MKAPLRARWPTAAAWIKAIKIEAEKLQKQIYEQSPEIYEVPTLGSPDLHVSEGMVSVQAPVY